MWAIALWPDGAEAEIPNYYGSVSLFLISIALIFVVFLAAPAVFDPTAQDDKVEQAFQVEAARVRQADTPFLYY
jgi:hypothetical protein